MPPTLTHLALHVRDLAACIEFYRRYCRLEIVRERDRDAGARGGGKGVVWLAEKGRERDFVFVLISGGPGRSQAGNDYSHLGFALPSRQAVDAIAARAREEGCLVWPPKQEPTPVGYYCGLKDPGGNLVEFSFGQPLGPGAGEDA